MTFMSARAEALANDERCQQRQFQHETLFYDGEDTFLRGTLPFITGALAEEEPMLVVVGEEKIKLIVDALGRDSARVDFADMRELGGNPARIIPAWRAFLERRAPDGRPVRGIGEPIYDGRSAAELTECQRHESLLNLAFDDGQAWRLLCPYDVGALDEQVIRVAEHTHPLVTQAGRSRQSEHYLDATEAPGPFDGSLPEPLNEPQEVTFTSERLASVRSAVSRWAADARLDAERAEHLVLSVSELATNSVLYGGGMGALWLWREDQALVCEVKDRGRIQEPLVGRSRPKADDLSGRGLWLVNQLCDLVQIRSSPAGSVVRVRMRLSA
jgi:anti-sigma regulatory factor (Ser/Thr protein kinase)